MQDSTYFQEIVSIGEVRGEARGEARGVARGERRAIVRMATQRFGPPDPATAAQLDAISDLDHLDRISLAVLTADGWADLFTA